jgi:hypothetical protein
MTWTVRDINRDRETIDAIDGHDDRSAAMVAGAYLEDRLTSTIQTYAENRLRPRATFREKIETAHRIGIFDENTTKVLDTIREIRNEFGHSLAYLTFNTPEISKLCDQLFHMENLKKTEIC